MFLVVVFVVYEIEDIYYFVIMLLKMRKLRKIPNPNFDERLCHGDTLFCFWLGFSRHQLSNFYLNKSFEV